MRLGLFAILFLLGVSAYAQNSGSATAVSLYLFNPEMRYERAESQDLEDRKPFNIAVGYQGSQFGLLTEYSRFSEGTGNDTAAIERSHQDLLVWFRYHVFKASLAEDVRGHVFVGAGAGGYTEEVTTTLMGASRTDKDQWKFQSGLVAGGEVSISIYHNWQFVAGLEGRTLFASDYEPNPLWSAVLRLGFQILL